MHPPVVRAAKAVFERFVVPLLDMSLPIIILWAKSVDIISAKEDITYNDGITGSHFGVGRIDQIIMPFQVSSSIAKVLKLSTAAFWD